MEKSMQDAAWQAIIAKLKEMDTSIPRIKRVDMAKMLCVDKSAISRWLNEDRGAAQKTVDIMVGYFNALGIDPAPYFGNNGGQGTWQSSQRIAYLEKQLRSVEAEKEQLKRDLITLQQKYINLLEKDKDGSRTATRLPSTHQLTEPEGQNSSL